MPRCAVAVRRSVGYVNEVRNGCALESEHHVIAALVTDLSTVHTAVQGRGRGWASRGEGETTSAAVIGPVAPFHALADREREHCYRRSGVGRSQPWVVLPSPTVYERPALVRRTRRTGPITAGLRVERGTPQLATLEMVSSGRADGLRTLALAVVETRSGPWRAPMGPPARFGTNVFHNGLLASAFSCGNTGPPPNWRQRPRR